MKRKEQIKEEELRDKLELTEGKQCVSVCVRQRDTKPETDQLNCDIKYAH